MVTVGWRKETFQENQENGVPTTPNSKIVLKKAHAIHVWHQPFLNNYSK